MLDIFLDGIVDSLRILPYLFVAFLVLEYLEHKLNSKSEKILEKGSKFGPFLGGILGALPQCGFSTMASNLFSSGVITTGTLIAIFLSTSDEMLPIMIGEQVEFLSILKIIGFKVLVGILFGFLVDIFYQKKKSDPHHEIHNHCDHDECHCKENGILLSSLIHTLKIFAFILLINLVLNTVIYFIGEDQLSHLLQHQNIFTYFLASLVGLIPNCASSVLITKLYLSELISIGTLFSGLLTGSGLGILLLFKENRNLKENLGILFTIYFIGVVVGFLVDIIL